MLQHFEENRRNTETAFSIKMLDGCESWFLQDLIKLTERFSASLGLGQIWCLAVAIPESVCENIRSRL